MRRTAFFGLGGLAAALFAGGLPSRPAAAMTTGVFVGTIDHVSSENLKVTNHHTGQSLSFLILPKFKNVWSDDGKTTYQMSFLHPGTPVKVFYDQKALGVRHADKIVVLKHL